jgi:hypothetical protein
MYAGNARQWNGKRPYGMVIDTGHWWRMKNSQALKAFTELGGYEAVRMVHLKFPSANSINSFLSRQPDLNVNLLRDFTRRDREGKIPVIIEAKNSALMLRGTVIGDTLQAIADRIEEITC